MNLRRNCDVLIVGGGIAGLSAALEAAERGLHVHILTKNKNIEESNTYYAQGGIVGSCADDTPQLLFDDILKAGCYVNNRKVVRFISEKGPEMVNRLLIEKAPVDFSKNDQNEYQLTCEAAHSVRRILHARDKTGQAISRALLKSVTEHTNIEFFGSSTALDLITNSHHSLDSQQRYEEKTVLGVYSLDNESGKVYTCFAGAVIIATGGIGHLFQHTSNPVCATGDGIAMAYRTGCEIINSEYVQFHPTTIFHRDMGNFLISESLRGEGAVLLNNKNQPFMERYNKELKDLAPRDEVSRAIYNEMEETDSDCVYLDARRIKNHDLKERFPNIFDNCMSLGIDIRKDLIPVVPAAHYFCGGIKVNIQGETSIKNLYAVGEAACTGLHGANRLASVSLMEGVVFGTHTAENIYKTFLPIDVDLLETIPDWVFPGSEESFDSILIGSDMITIQTIMWNYVGIKRSKKRLERALADLNYLHHRIERFYKTSYVTREVIELRNSVEVALLVTKAAQSNLKSLGCHYIPTKGE